jgi:uncharacterized protein (TIGR03032 family)
MNMAGSKVNEEPKAPEAVRYSMSGGLVQFLHAQNLAIAFTSYQSGRLYLLGRNPKGGLMVNEQDFRKAMGLHVHGKSLYLATLGHIYRLENCLRPDQWMDETFSQCFIPRTAYFTGHLDAHDVGVTSEGEIIFVNTRFNCLATISSEHSFRPIWRPFFVTKLADEDRCHLNGLAMSDGRARYVTAVSKSDTIDAWRDRRADGGIVIDVDENEIICEGLSMPHSPRFHDDRLWVLNSGTGELGIVDRKEGRFEPVAFCPGFVRGLSFHGRYAFVGLSRPRYARFEGLALDARLNAADSEPWTGIQVIDLESGACVQWFRIDGPVAELYDVAVLPGVGCAKSVGFATDEAYGIITMAD